MLELNYRALGMQKAMDQLKQITPELQLRTLAVGRRTAMANLVHHAPGRMGRADAWSSRFDKSKGIVDFFSNKYPMKIIQFMEAGTRPHPIVPVAAQALRFMVAGKAVFAKSVMHPGTKPYKMIEQAARGAALAMRECGRRYGKIR